MPEVLADPIDATDSVDVHDSVTAIDSQESTATPVIVVPHSDPAPALPPIPSANVDAINNIAPAVDYDAAATNVINDTVIVSIQTHRPGITRQVAVEQVYTGNADSRLLSASKKILKSPELEAVRALDTKAKKELKDRNLILPSHLRGGFFCVPRHCLAKVCNLLNDYKTQRKELIEQASATYEQRRSETLASLGDLANEADYESLQEFRENFELSVTFHADNVPRILETVSPELYAEAQASLREHIKDNVEDIVVALRVQFAEVVTNLADVLKIREDGSKPKLHASTVEKLRSYCEAFGGLNLANDNQLAELVSQAQNIIGGVDGGLATIKSRDDVRSHLANELSKISEKVREEAFINFETGRRRFGVERD